MDSRERRHTDSQSNRDQPITGPPSGSMGNSRSRSSRILAFALGAGLFTGFASFALGELLLEAFRPPLERSEVMGRVLMKANFHDQASADYKNAMVSFTILGSLLSASLGFAGGLSQGSKRLAMIAGLAGIVLGGILAGSASYTLLPVYFHAEDVSKEELSRDLMLPLLVHGGIWAAAGLGGGIAFGIGLHQGRARLIKAALGGFIGAAVASAIYEILGAAIFPGGKTTPPLASEWSHRLLARLLVTSLAAAFASAFVTSDASRK